MRVTGGTYRGRSLFVPKGNAIRPATDKVRQAVFNILGSSGIPADMTVLDGFCGTGALGIEALSRGARFCFFMDQSRTSLTVCRRNLEALGLAPSCYELLSRNLTRPGPKPADLPAADLVFLDPPYRKSLLSPALTALAENGWVAPDAVCVTECEKESAAESRDDFSLLDERVYGAIAIRFYRYEGSLSANSPLPEQG